MMNLSPPKPAPNQIQRRLIIALETRTRTLILKVKLLQWTQRRQWKLLASYFPSTSLVAVLVVANFFLIGCFESPLSPVAPSWDVTVNVPLGNRSYTVNELIEKDPKLFHSDPSGLLVYSTSEKFSGIGVGENLKVDPVTENFQSRIGKFSVKTPASLSRQVSLGEINPALGSHQGNNIAVPPFNFSLTGQNLPTILEFDRVTLASGQAVLTMVNRLAIPLDNISLTVRSQYGSLTQFSYAPTVRPGDSIKHTFSLANSTIGNSVSFDFSGRCPGTEGTVRVDTSSGVLVRIEVPSDIEAVHAVAKLPANTFTTSGSLSIDDSTKIESATIRSGSVIITLNNTFGVSGQASIVIPELRQPNGSPFTQSIPFSAWQQNIRQIVLLDGYTVRSPDGRLNYTLTAETFDTGNNKVTIDSSMSILASLATSEISFQLIRGKIKPTTVDVNVTRSFDLGDANRIFRGTVRFSRARLVLTLKSTAQYTIDLNTTITGRNRSTGQRASLSLPAEQRRVSYPQTTITLTEANSNIVSFLNGFTDQFPDEFTLSGNVVVNPTYSSGSASAADSIGIDLAIEVPLTIGIVNGLARDTLSMDLSSDTRKEIDKANYGKISLEILNGLAVGVQLSLEILDSRRQPVLRLPKAQQPPLAVTAAQVDGQGRVVLPASSTPYVELVADDVKKFLQVEYVAFSISIGTSGGGNIPVQFRTSDEIRLRAYATLNYRVN